MLTVSKKLALVKNNQISDQTQLKLASSSAANYLQINSAWCNIKIYSSSDIGKVRKNIWLLHAYIYLGVFNHFRASIAASVINFDLEHSFYIDINAFNAF